MSAMKGILDRKRAGGNVMQVSELRGLAAWHASIEAIRNMLMAQAISGMSFDQAPAAVARAQQRVDAANELAARAVAAGRLIDLGHLPNEVIRAQAARAAGLYRLGHIGVPFVDPFVIYHTWEEGGSVYLVNLIEKDRPNGGRLLVIEAQAHKLRGEPRLLLGDVGEFSCDVLGKYTGDAAPAAWRSLGPEGEGNNPQGALANLADPVVTAMLLLATDHVGVSTVEAPAKLNKARVKSGKAPIPSHRRVDTAAYVTAIQARLRGRSVRGDGHHSSPIAHLRRGHIRHLADGRTTWVRDALVAFREGANTPPRQHYDATRAGRPGGAP